QPIICLRALPKEITFEDLPEGPVVLIARNTRTGDVFASSNWRFYELKGYECLWRQPAGDTGITTPSMPAVRLPLAKSNRPNAGFTLLELMWVISILGVLL